MFRPEMSEFSLSGFARGPKPSYKPAVEALEERVVLNGGGFGIGDAVAGAFENLPLGPSHFQISDRPSRPRPGPVRLGDANALAPKVDLAVQRLNKFAKQFEKVLDEAQNSLFSGRPTQQLESQAGNLQQRLNKAIELLERADKLMNKVKDNSTLRSGPLIRSLNKLQKAFDRIKTTVSGAQEFETLRLGGSAPHVPGMIPNFLP